METPPIPTVLLFSYGTLQKASIQIANFGRQLCGREDALPGYTRRVMPVADPRIAALIGQSHYATVEPGLDPEEAVPGMVLEITDQELAAADRYETAAGYRRISVRLRSGVQAWVYVQG